MFLFGKTYFLLDKMRAKVFLLFLVFVVVSVIFANEVFAQTSDCCICQTLLGNSCMRKIVCPAIFGLCGNDCPCPGTSSTTTTAESRQCTQQGGSCKTKCEANERFVGYYSECYIYYLGMQLSCCVPTASTTTTSSIPADSCCCETSQGFGCMLRSTCTSQGRCASDSCQPCPPVSTTSSIPSGNCCCATSNLGNVCASISECGNGAGCLTGAIQCNRLDPCSSDESTTTSTSGSTTTSTSGATCDQNTACTQDGSLNDPQCCTDFPMCVDKRCCKPGDYTAEGHPEQCCYGLKSDGVHCAAQPCANQNPSTYGNRICRSDASIDNCNWPSATENVIKREISNGMWEVNFTSSSATNVNVFVVYGRVIGISQPDWKPASYLKPAACPEDSYELVCNPQLLGTHNYCSFRLPPNPMIVDLPNPSIVTVSNPARAIMPLSLSRTTHTALITINITEEARRRGIPAVLYYQFYKNLTGGNYYSGCVPGTACSVNDCGGIYTGCSYDTIGIREMLCVRTQTSNTPQLLPACWHSPWESQLWDRMNLTYATTSATIPLSCSVCYAGSKCNCTVNGCSAGTWTVRNTTYPPAMETRTSNIPPATIEFTPTASGSLEVTASCSNPQQTNKTTVDVRGVTNMLTCPSSCYVGKECECQISGCNNGNFIVMNGSITVKTFTFPPVTSSIKFIHNSTGMLTVTGACSEPQKGPITVNVSIISSNVTSSTTTSSTSSTTTTIELKECPQNECCVSRSGYEDKSCPEGQTCKGNKCQGGEGGGMLSIAILVIAVLVGVYFLYFFVLKKRTKLTYDTLYRKWPAKPRRY